MRSSDQQGVVWLLLSSRCPCHKEYTMLHAPAPAAAPAGAAVPACVAYFAVALGLTRLFPVLGG